jgi:hypothetical protein
MIPQHYILIPNKKHSSKIKDLIEEGLLITGKSYPIDKTPTLYDPQTYRPTNKWMLVLNPDKYKAIIIEDDEFRESFTSLQNWRNIQISKLTGELPNQPLIEYLNYLNTQVLLIKEELIKNSSIDTDITIESEIIGQQIKGIKEKLRLK